MNIPAVRSPLRSLHQKNGRLLPANAKSPEWAAKESIR